MPSSFYPLCPSPLHQPSRFLFLFLFFLMISSLRLPSIKSFPFSALPRSLSLSLSLSRSSPSSFSLPFSTATQTTQTTLTAFQNNNSTIPFGRAKAVDRGQHLNLYSPIKNPTLAETYRLFPADRKRPFVVLGIETSCDDTGAAVVNSDGVILGEALASQEGIHANFGGVVPGLARDAHSANIQCVIHQALANAKMDAKDVDAIGVTVGPGLEICLRVGCEAAKALAIAHSKPFVAVHHLEAHVLMARLPPPIDSQINSQTNSGTDVQFPFLALLVSGGHCQILKCHAVGEYAVIGGTIDDSLGEAYDKVARMLNLRTNGGPGGAAVERIALLGDRHANIKLPIPMHKRKDCDFSFAGLKNAFRVVVRKLREERGISQDEDLSEQDKADLAYAFQSTAIKHLEQRINRVIAIEKENASKLDTLVLVGGVAANTAIRDALNEVCLKNRWALSVPPPRLCTDNGIMIAWAAIEKLRCGMVDVAEGQEVFARFPFKNVTIAE